MTAAPASSEKIVAPDRAADLDLFKTMLVWGMITAHCIQLLAFRPKPLAGTISDVINLITFSGFMFAFGLGLGLSRGRTKGWWARLRPAMLLLLATWVSEISFVALVEKAPLTSDLLWNIVSLSRLYGWSEFLASFFVLYLIIAAARPGLVAIGATWYLLVPTAILCFASTAIVISLDVPLLATLVGTTNFASFPLPPYLPWFLVGIYYARHHDHPVALDWVMAAGATGVCALHVALFHGQYPVRFPPTILWIVGPSLILLLYLVFARWFCRLVRIPAFLLGTGRHVLAALLVSNLTIFGLRHLVGFRLGQWWWTPIFAVFTIATVTLWTIALDRLQTRLFPRERNA